MRLKWAPLGDRRNSQKTCRVPMNSYSGPTEQHLVCFYFRYASYQGTTIALPGKHECHPLWATTICQGSGLHARHAWRRKSYTCLSPALSNSRWTCTSALETCRFPNPLNDVALSHGSVPTVYMGRLGSRTPHSEEVL